MRKILLFLFTLILLSGLSSTGFAAVHFVSSGSGTAHEPPFSKEDPSESIARAIAYASPGDSVYVQTGTYNEHVWLQSPLNLVGGWNADFTATVGRSRIQSPDLTEYEDRPPIQINARIGYQGVTSVEDELLIQNFELRSLGVPAAGGGITGSHEITTTIDNCLIEGNAVELHGGAVKLFCSGNSRTTFSSNIIRGNISDILCGGIYVADTNDGLSPSVRFINNMIHGNNKSGIYVISNEGTDQGGIHVTLINNTISGQQYGLYLNPYLFGRVVADVINSILWGNTSYDILPCTINPTPEKCLRSTVRVGHSIYETVLDPEMIIQDQGGNFSDDPLLEDDFRLSADSPAARKGLCDLYDGTRIAPFTDFEGDPRPKNCTLRCTEYSPASGECIEGFYEGCAIGADEPLPNILPALLLLLIN
ncbi:MAG: DUF1565 domain-containing protein [Desulfobacteraceae bacterium]|nr:DUF1565 domain-containing protein [Desulfobacteraceae bacterium]